jgi:hypothetical protein
MATIETRSPQFNDALKRLMELDSEAVQSQASCEVVVRITYQKGKAQHVRDERTRYER